MSEDILRFAKLLTVASAIGIVAPIVYLVYVAPTATDGGPAAAPRAASATMHFGHASWAYIL
jgi:hypothetical protein